MSPTMIPVGQKSRQGTLNFNCAICVFLPGVPGLFLECSWIEEAQGIMRNDIH